MSRLEEEIRETMQYCHDENCAGCHDCAYAGPHDAEDCGFIGCSDVLPMTPPAPPPTPTRKKAYGKKE